MRRTETLTIDGVDFDVEYIPDKSELMLYEIRLQDHDVDLYSVLSEKIIDKIYQELEEG